MLFYYYNNFLIIYIEQHPLFGFETNDISDAIQCQVKSLNPNDMSRVFWTSVEETAQSQMPSSR